MNIAVYLGSNHGNSPIYDQAACDLGSWIGLQHHTLVYGGAGVGTMKTLADHVKAVNGRVIGVMPKFMIAQGKGYDSLDEQYLTDTMSQRKSKMIELADAFIAMPGGPGTLEEIAEVISLVRLKQKDAVCILLNLNGYYDCLKQQFEVMISSGFYQRSDYEQIHFADSVKEIELILNRRAD